VAMCQDAALLTMQRDMDAVFVRNLARLICMLLPCSIRWHGATSWKPHTTCGDRSPPR
jgi:hypothetical protein